MKRHSLRLDDEVSNELKYLTSIYGISQNSVVSNLIRQEYNKFKEDPKLRVALEQAQQLQEAFNRMTSELEKAGFKK